MQTKIEMIGFDYQDATTIQEINRNIYVLIGTPAGSCAGDRRYGIDQSFVGLPAAIAENMLAIELMEKVPEYEPRADVLEVTCVSDTQGRLVATVKIGPNEEYDPDEEEYEEEADEEEYEEDEEEETEAEE